MGRFRSRPLLLSAVGGVALVVASACTDTRGGGGPGERTGTARERLSRDEFGFEGLDLPAKTLVLTFDDGPGSPSVVSPLLTFLKANGIKATFFVNGACIAPLVDAKGRPLFSGNESCTDPDEEATTSLGLMVADGHLIGNHTSTHRSLTGEDGPLIPANESVNDLMFTHDLISGYGTWNRRLFRPPFGDWQRQPDYSDSIVFDRLNANPTLATYTGPVYWSVGGEITAHSAADWDCWQRSWSTMRCGDLYLDEISRVGKGIVLMHNAKGNPNNHSLSSGQGNTVDMVKYIVPKLVADGYTFKPLWEDPAIAAAFPKCDASCATCNGESSTSCLTCASGKYLSGGSCSACTVCAAGTFTSAACTPTANTVCPACTTCPAGRHPAAACTTTADTTCVDDVATTDGGAGDAGHDAAAPEPGTPSSSGGTTGPGSPGGGGATGAGGGADAGESASPGASGGCATAPGFASTPWTLATLGLAGLALRRRRRQLRADHP